MEYIERVVVSEREFDIDKIVGDPMWQAEQSGLCSINDRQP